MNEKNAIKADMKLANFKSFPGHDGIGISAKLVYKGIAIANIYDAAYGGECEINALGYATPVYVRNKGMLEELIERIKKLPAEHNDELDFDMQPDLDFLINELADEMITLNEMKKHFPKGILYADSPEYEDYTIIQWNGSIPSLVRKHGDKFRDIIKKKVEELSNQGKFIINREYLIKRQGVKL